MKAKLSLLYITVAMQMTCQVALACGLQGNIDDRIASCHLSLTDSNQVVWSKVAEFSYEYDDYSMWMDMNTHVIYLSAVLMSQESANKICNSDSTFPLLAKIKAPWKINSVEDYQTVFNSGIYENTLRPRVIGQLGPYWTDVDSQMVDEVGKHSSNYPGNAMYTICRAQL